MHKLNEQISASDIAEICLEEDIEIPGLGAENQTVEQGPQQIGKIMGGLFKDAAEVLFDEFRGVRQQEQGRSEAGYPGTGQSPTPPRFRPSPLSAWPVAR